MLGIPPPRGYDDPRGPPFLDPRGPPPRDLYDLPPRDPRDDWRAAASAPFELPTVRDYREIAAAAAATGVPPYDPLTDRAASALAARAAAFYDVPGPSSRPPYF